MKILYIKYPTNSEIEIQKFSGVMQIIEFNPKLYNSNLQLFIEELGKYEFDGVIISDFIEDSYLGLEICIRIRLSRQLLGQRSYCTFFIYTEENPNEILNNQINLGENTTSTLFMTRGVYKFDNFDLLILQLNNPKNFNLLNKANFNEAVLKFLILKKPSNIGNHSLANIWGAYRLAEITGYTEKLAENTKQEKYKSDLYFMYLIAHSPKIENITSHTKINIPSMNKKILFIDDEADKGWEDVLKELFVGSNFESVAKGESENADLFFNKASLKALEKDENGLPKWDLILLDLRLDETEDLGENANKLALEYSGAKLLQSIKKDNRGTQVVIFTASNKAWNMRELIDMGADGFYFKESPEYSSDLAFSTKNFESFKKQVELCFEKDSLRYIYSINLATTNVLDIQDKLYDSNFASKRRLIRMLLQLAFNSIYNYTSSSKEHAIYSFLEYYKIIEIFGKELIKDENYEKQSSGYYVKGKRNEKIEFISFLPKCRAMIKPKKKDGFLISYTAQPYEPVGEDLKYYMNPNSSMKFAGIMLLRFRFKDSEVENFIRLNNLRNSLVAHSGNISKLELNTIDVIQLAELIKESFVRI